MQPLPVSCGRAGLPLQVGPDSGNVRAPNGRQVVDVTPIVSTTLFDLRPINELGSGFLAGTEVGHWVFAWALAESRVCFR